MEKSFNARTPVLFQNPTHPMNYRNPKKRWILVPMCAYKVSVPYPRDNALNIFQETILKLLNSGSRTASKGYDPMSLNETQWMAGALCLREELVNFILKELQDRNLIDKRRRVTDLGNKMLQEGAAAYEMATGYVFYNYATKTYMDAFIPDDKYNEVDTLSRREGKIKFCTNHSAADPKPKTGIVINTDTTADVEPNVYEILNICKRHSKRSRRIGFRYEESEEVVTLADKERMKAELPGEVKSVRLLGSKRDIYVATYLFMDAGDILNLSKMQVCYPFGEGVSPSILEAVEKLTRTSENETLKAEIIGLKQEVNSLNDTELEEIRKNHSNAESAIKSLLSEEIHKYPAVLDMLLAVEESYQLVGGLIRKNKGGNIEIIKEKMKEYIRNNYNLISSILIYTIRANDSFRESEVHRHNEQNAVMLSEYAKRIGFENEVNVFESFFRLKKGTITNSVREQHMSGLFAYNIICAKNSVNHPFYRLAEELPDFISYLFRLRNLRNESSHANDVMRDFDTLREYRKKNMYIAYLLLDGLTFREEKRQENEDNLDKINFVKVQREAERLCDEKYTENMRRNSNIVRQLRNLQSEIYIQGDGYPRCASEVFESIFKAIGAKRIDLNYADSFGDYMDEEENKRILAQMQGLGFCISKLPFYRKSDVTATMRMYANGTLMTLFYAFYFSEMARGSDIFGKLAAGCPEFITLLSEIHENRGHIGKMAFSDPKLDYTKKHIDHAVNTLLDVLAEAEFL